VEKFTTEKKGTLTQRRAMDKNSYNHEFIMYLEGQLCSFSSINLQCTQEGVVASINIPYNDKVSLIPVKSMVQVFFRRWFEDGTGSNRLFHLLFDGYTSMEYKVDSSLGRMVSVVCRDFRMDIRKTPSIFTMDDETLQSSAPFAINGLNTDLTKKKATSSSTKDNLLTSGLMLLKNCGIEGTKVTKDTLKNIIYGVWDTATSGSRMAIEFNNRLDVTKKMAIFPNSASVKYFNMQYGNELIGSHLLNSSYTSSVESIMFRAAGLFSMKPFGVCCPPVIRTDSVKIAETIVIPPLDFTAPPACNIMFPSMYERVETQFDYDSDYTRAYFNVQGYFDQSTGAELTQVITIPGKIATTHIEPEANYSIASALTKEEMLKGINVLYDTVSQELAGYQNGAANTELNVTLEKHAVVKFVNARFAGRVATCNMSFNPYLMPGFPGVIVADKYGNTGENRSIIGTVQTVKHVIDITTNSCEASTSVTLNNARYINEPSSYDFLSGEPSFDGNGYAKDLLGDRSVAETYADKAYGTKEIYKNLYTAFNVSKGIALDDVIGDYGTIHEAVQKKYENIGAPKSYLAAMNYVRRDDASIKDVYATLYTDFRVEILDEKGKPKAVPTSEFNWKVNIYPKKFLKKGALNTSRYGVVESYILQCKDDTIKRGEK